MDTLDLGARKLASDNSFSFDLHNRGEEPIVLGSIETDCGFSEARLSQSFLEPGETATFAGAVMVPEVGPVSIDVRVPVTGRAECEAVLTIRAVGTPTLRLGPDPVYVGRIEGDSGAACSVSAVDHELDDGELPVLEIDDLQVVSADWSREPETRFFHGELVVAARDPRAWGARVTRLRLVAPGRNEPSNEVTVAYELAPPDQETWPDCRFLVPAGSQTVLEFPVPVSLRSSPTELAVTVLPSQGGSSVYLTDRAGPSTDWLAHYVELDSELGPVTLMAVVAPIPKPLHALPTLPWER